MSDEPKYEGSMLSGCEETAAKYPNPTPVDSVALLKELRQLSNALNWPSQIQIVDRAHDLIAALTDTGEEPSEAIFKDAFVQGFEHRDRTDDPTEAVKGAIRAWNHRLAMRTAGKGPR